MTPWGRVELGTLRQADLEEREKEEGGGIIDRTEGDLIRDNSRFERFQTHVASNSSLFPH
jgi:hypothetical protein